MSLIDRKEKGINHLYGLINIIILATRIGRDPNCEILVICCVCVCYTLKSGVAVANREISNEFMC